MHIYPAKKKETNLATNLEKSKILSYPRSICIIPRSVIQQNGSFMGFLSHDDILRHFGSVFTQVSQMINQTKGTAGAPC